MENNAQPLPPPPPPLLAGIGVAAVVVAALVGWVILGSQFLSDTSLFGGFLVLWYWAKVEHLAMQKLPATVLGGLVGIGVSWVMFYGVSHYGGAGFAVGLLALFIAVYLDVVQVSPLFVNASTMLFSLIAAAPLIQFKVNWIELCLATIGGGVFFGAFVALVFWIGRKFPQKSA